MSLLKFISFFFSFMAVILTMLSGFSAFYHFPVSVLLALCAIGVGYMSFISKDLDECLPK